ncbi:MAG: Ig-like domain-containing protein, partial [Pyrinomonadaceae bacterium]
HVLTAVAVDNRGGATTSAAVRVQIGRTPGTQITSTTHDGQSNFGPSVVTQIGPPVDKELADDFDITGDIDRVIVNGSRGFSSPQNPTIRGAYVRFYAWNNGTPGALKDETFLPDGDPGLVYNRQNPAAFDITLPHSFRSNGKNFVSVQLLVEGYAGYWYWLSAHTGAPQNSPVKIRDNYAGGAWGPIVEPTGTVNADAVIQLYGTLTSPGNVTSVAPQTVERSGYFTVTGTNFGAQQGTSRLLVDKLAAIVVSWSATEIIGYVPEGARLGAVPVEVSNSLGVSNSVNLTVTDRQQNGRIRWRARVWDSYVRARAVVAPQGSPEAGSIYVNATNGLTYAWSQTGALKWITRAGGNTTISVGPDGTLYLAGNMLTAPQTVRAVVIALNPNGTEKWRVIDSTAYQVLAGPSVGPDGKIYVVFEQGQYNNAAFNPDGTLAWSRNDLNLRPGSGNSAGDGKEIAFGRSLARLYFGFNINLPFNTGRLFSYDLNGNRIFMADTNGACCRTPAVPPDENPRSYGGSFSSQDGHQLYYFNSGTAVDGNVDAGTDNTHYLLQQSKIYAINPNGTQKWRYVDLNTDNTTSIPNEPVVSPANDVVFFGGIATYGKGGYFVGVNPATGQRSWKIALADEEGFGATDYNGKIRPTNRPVFAPDGSTAYASADVAGLFDRSYFYAINTTPGNVPVNQPPVPTLTYPPPNINLGRNTQINLTATVQDDGQIDRVEFYNNHNFNPTLIGIDRTPDANGIYSFPFTATDVGGYGIFAVAYDTGGLRGDTPINFINVQNAPPSVRWLSPTDGTNFAPPPTSLTLNVNATDRDGTITKVEFYDSESGLIGEDASADSSSNFSVVLTNLTVGTHTLAAYATDNDGTRIGSSITVNVNAAPTPSP